MVGQQGVGRLVRRKMRGDVADAHERIRSGRNRSAASRGRRKARVELRNVAGRAPSSVTANCRNRSSRSKNASSSACVRLYGLPPTIASLEWKMQVQRGTPSAARRRASAHISSNEENDGRSQSSRASRASAGRASSCTATARAPRHAPAPAACGDAAPPSRGSFEHLARARPDRASRTPGSTASAALREVGPALVRLVEQRGDARIDEIAVPLQRRHVRGREAEPAGPIRHRPRADCLLDRRVNAASCASNARASGRARNRWRLDIRRRRRRRLPRVMVRADLAVAAQHAGRAAPRRSRVAGHRPGDHVRRPHAVSAKGSCSAGSA